MWVNDNRVVCLIFIILGFLLTLPAFYQGMIVSDDILVYSNWHKCFSDQLFAGEWYPRWLMDMNGGRGSPIFFFYPPLPFYISALFEYFTPQSYPAWYALYLSFGLALALSGVTSFFLLKNYTQDKQSFLLALFYMLAPYHLFVNFYHRFAYPEFWAFTWIPLVFYFLSKALKDKWRHKIGLAISYSLVLLTHIPTFIILTPIIIIYLLVKAKSIQCILKVFSSLVLGFLASSFYVIPMLFYQGYVSFDKMWDGRYSLYSNFLMSGGGFGNSYYFKITLINFIIITIIFFAVEKLKNKENVFWIALGYFSIFLMFKMSSFIWYTVPLIDKIQFPWRLNMFTLLSVIILSATAFSHEGRSFSKKNTLLKKLIIVVLFSQVVSVFILILPLEKSVLSHEEMERVSHETKVKLGVIEYIPRWASDEIFSRMKYRDLNKLEANVNLSSPGDLLILKWLPRTIVAKTSSDTGFTATVRQFYFPYWQVTSVNDEKSIKTSPNQEGYLQLDIPPGNHIITAKLIEGPPEIAGKILSLFAILFMAFSLLFRFVVSRNPQRFKSLKLKCKLR